MSVDGRKGNKAERSLEGKRRSSQKMCQTLLDTVYVLQSFDTFKTTRLSKPQCFYRDVRLLFAASHQGQKYCILQRHPTTALRLSTFLGLTSRPSGWRSQISFPTPSIEESDSDIQSIRIPAIKCSKAKESRQDGASTSNANVL